MTTNAMMLGPYPRRLLAALVGVNMALGLVFYTIPSEVISYWAWPVKDLAVRFLGAIFLAISLGCGSALTAKQWQRAKILVLVGFTFFGLTGMISLAQALAMSDNSDAWLWASYSLVTAISLLAVLLRNRWHRKQVETVRVPVALTPSRIFFAIQTTVVGIFGIMMIVIPSIAQEQFWPWRVATPTLQTFGALFLATCLATGWAFFQRDPARIIVLLPLDAIFPSLALLAVGISWNTIIAESPSGLVTGVWVFLYSFVALGSTILFVTLRQQSKVPQ